MQPSNFIIPCGGLTAERTGNGDTVELPLELWAGKDSNVTLKVGDFEKGLFKTMSPQFADLMDIASYVYCADQATSRGALDVDNFGSRWRRRFTFRIPVRAPKFWMSEEVGRVLRETLEFLSDDTFDFAFVGGVSLPGMTDFFENLQEGTGQQIERVVLFSGGLDSLAGAVEETVVSKRRVLLVTHRPTSKLNNVQRNLENLLAEKAGAFRPMHSHVRAWKDSELNKNYTQRTRSFLYAAVGATMARMVGLDTLRFYENGVVSMNLPICAQVVGTRATRTTHPRALADFERLLSLVAGSPFFVKNDFIWDTKAEVINRIVKAGCEDLIKASLSCAHVYAFCNEHPHCGTCSQCIDRRVAIVAAEAEAHDPASRYDRDVFTGARPTEEDRMMIASYVERAKQLKKIRNFPELISKYPEVIRAVKYLPGTHLAVGERLLELHRKHAKEVDRAIQRVIVQRAEALHEGTLPQDCLLRLVVGSGGGVSAAKPESGPGHEAQEARWEKEREGPRIYRLTKNYKVWQLVYQGRKALLDDERAVALTEYLLKNPPDVPIHASELELRVYGGAAVDSAVGAGAAVGGVVQEASGKKLMGGLGPILTAELRELRATTTDMSIPAEERDAAEERIKVLLKAHERGGRLRGGAEQANDRVRKAISALIDTLKAAPSGKGEPHITLREFGEHLEEYLWKPSKGVKGRGALGKPGCYTYTPPPGVVWRD